MARMSFEPRPCWSRARRFNHSITLPTTILEENSKVRDEIKVKTFFLEITMILGRKK